MSPETYFLRQNDLSIVLQSINQNTLLPTVIIGKEGVGKTTLLREAHRACQFDGRLLPIFCVCKSNETPTCSMVRIEGQLASYIRLAASGEKFQAFLATEIDRKLSDFVWSRPVQKSESAEAEF